MRHRTLLSCCLLLVVAAVSAQSRPATDVISGKWVGDMGRTETNRLNITVKMKLEGEAVSGTITGPPSPGVIKGAFDAKTGALKFEVTLKDGNNPPAYFDGTVVKGVASGKVTINNQDGSFKITKEVK